jgi:methylase of polypeptide subunit release factors
LLGLMTRTADAALLDLLRLLDERGYAFVTPTPATHARVSARPDKTQARDLRDVLGWSLPFAPGTIDPKIADLLRQAGMIEALPDGLLRSRLRVSRLHGKLFLHSAYPTDARDAVFFGPDSYRFADLIAAELSRAPLAPGAHVVDLGAGAGVGGIVAAMNSAGARVTLTDLNPKALRMARINAAAAGIEAETVETDTLDPVGDPIDLAVINPPYIVDEASRAYRDGGGMHGGKVPLDMTQMAADRLAPGGRLILYTGAAIVGGRNTLCEAVGRMAQERSLAFACREIDPDVFGEELARPAYRDVERIALVAVTLKRSC